MAHCCQASLCHRQKICHVPWWSRTGSRINGENAYDLNQRSRKRITRRRFGYSDPSVAQSRRSTPGNRRRNRSTKIAIRCYWESLTGECTTERVTGCDAARASRQNISTSRASGATTNAGRCSSMTSSMRARSNGAAPSPRLSRPCDTARMELVRPRSSGVSSGRACKHGKY
jgi:hypothetical protein